LTKGEAKELAHWIISSSSKLYSKVNEADLAALRHIRSGHALQHSPTCPVCITGKLHAIPKSVNSFIASAFNEKISLDLLGPITPNRQNIRFAAIAVDAATRWKEVEGLVAKSEAWRILRLWIMRHGKPSVVRSDNAGELTMSTARDIMTNNNIQLETTTPYLHRASGLIERSIQSLCQIARCLLLQAGLDARFWLDSLTYASYISNRLPHAGLPNKVSPYEMRYGKPPDVDKLRTFGARVIYLPPAELQVKSQRFPSVARSGRFLGFHPFSHSPLVWDLDSDKVVETRSLRYLESLDTSRDPPLEDKEFGELIRSYWEPIEELLPKEPDAMPNTLTPSDDEKKRRTTKRRKSSKCR